MDKGLEVSEQLDERCKKELEKVRVVCLKTEYAMALIEHHTLMEQGSSIDKYIDEICYLSRFALVVENHLKLFSVNCANEEDRKLRRILMLGIFNFLNSAGHFNHDFKRESCIEDEGNPLAILSTACGRIKGLLGKELYFNEKTLKFELKE
jgi:hypothetical protein